VEVLVKIQQTYFNKDIKMKKEVKSIKIIFLLLGIILFSSLVSSGIGIKKYQESMLVNEGQEACIAVGAYNPFPTGTNVIIGVSDGLKDVLVLQEAEKKYLPPDTSSDHAIDLKFCFKVPEVYHRDCSIAGKFICKLDCTEPQQVYSGEIFLQSVPSPLSVGGTGGSTTTMSVSQDMRVRVACTPHSRDYTLIYVVVAVICAIVIFTILFRKYRKPRVERDREKLKKLRVQLAKESRKKK
jgi:hypothetical protein